MLAAVLSIALFVIYCFVSSDWSKRFTRVYACGALFLMIELMGGVRGGRQGHILFLYSVAMVFLVVNDLGGLFMVRRHRREKGLANPTDPSWYLTFRRNSLILAACLSLLMLLTQSLPVWY